MKKIISNFAHGFTLGFKNSMELMIHGNITEYLESLTNPRQAYERAKIKF